MKHRQTSKLKIAQSAPAGFRANSQTSCPAGSFETAASLDAQAAIIRNRSWATVPAQKNWDSEHSGISERESMAVSGINEL